MKTFNEESVARFYSVREGSNSWVHNPDLIRAWKDGRLLDVMPFALEFSPSLMCNLRCVTCPYDCVRKGGELSRLRVPRGAFATPNDVTVISMELARLVIDRAIEAGVSGIVWTGGGEPTVIERLPEMIRYAAERGAFNGLYSNGINLGVHERWLPAALLDPRNNMVFARLSLNFASPEVGRVFSEASPEDIEAQFRGLQSLFAARRALLERYPLDHVPSLQVSVICNRQNVQDLPRVFEMVTGIVAAQDYHHRNDAIVVRPLTMHCGIYSFSDHEDWVIQDILKSCGCSASPRRRLEEAGMNVRLGFGLERVETEGVAYGDLNREEYAGRDCCWANGLFLTVGPDAKVHLCTDRNCYPSWAVGDLKTHTVAQIYHSPERRALLDKVHSYCLGPEVCEPTCRAVRLNRVAKAIQSGELTDADIKEIRCRSAGERPLLLS